MHVFSPYHKPWHLLLSEMLQRPRQLSSQCGLRPGTLRGAIDVISQPSFHLIYIHIYYIIIIMLLIYIIYSKLCCLYFLYVMFSRIWLILTIGRLELQVSVDIPSIALCFGWEWWGDACSYQMDSLHCLRIQSILMLSFHRPNANYNVSLELNVDVNHG